MCLSYAGVCVLIILLNLSAVPGLLGDIVTQAFTPAAAYGGFLGVFIQGVRRAAFSNEAGIGSAAVAHSAVRTHHPVTEGFVALLEPFIDTIIVCSITALVITCTVYDPANPVGTASGVELTSSAFASVIPWFPYVRRARLFLP